MKKSFLLLTMLFPLATLFSSGSANAADPDKSEYDAAMAAIIDGNYYLVTDVEGIKYYVTSEGSLTGEKEYGGIFTISKTSGGELYDIGILIEPGTGSHFSNTTLIGNKANLHPGTFCLNSVYNRDNWERQVFFLNTEGKFAIRTSNTTYGTSGYYDAGRTFWTYKVNDANIPTPCYSYDPAYVWTLESSMNNGTIMINGINYILDNDRMTAEVTFLPNNVKYSGNVVIPSSISFNDNTYTVTGIGNSAFRDCIGLTSITISESIMSVGGNAFYGCISMQKVIVSDLAAWCEISFAGYDSNPLSIAHHLYSNEFTEITKLVIPDGVTRIGSYSFRDCTGLTSVIIPNTVTFIGDCAFDSCSGLTSITIPNSVTTIGYGALWGCSGLTYIPIPNSVTDIGGKAFEKCNGLTSITIPESVTNIGEYAFRYCSSLEKVIVPDIGAWCGISFGNYTANPLTLAHHLFIDESTEITNLVIPDGVTSIGNYAFREIPDVISLTIPNSVTSIGDYAFDRCTGLTSLTFPNSVTSIGYAALWGCTGLTSVTIGSSMTNIDEIAFEGCSNLSDFYCYAEVVPITNLKAFQSSPITSATLHVPATSVALYEATEPWNRFGMIVALKATYALTYYVDSEVYKTYEVEEGATITPEPAPVKAGYSFSGWSEIPATMPAHDVTVTGSFIVNLATGIALDRESLIFNTTDTQKLNVTLTPDNLVNKTVSWSSTDTEIATVDEEGVVTPVNNGEACIIVCTTDGTDLEARCKVTVDFKAATLSLDKEEVTITALESIKLNATITPEKASQVLTWSSSDASTVAVDETGTITPLRNGEATVTATTTDGTELKTTCTVTVSIPSQLEVIVTQTTLAVRSRNGVAEAKDIRVTIDGETYDLGDKGRLTGLAPNKTYHVEANANIGGYNWTEELDATTEEIAVNFDCKASPTTLDISAIYDAGDATVISAGFNGEEEENALSLSGLEPAQTYDFTYYITTEEGGTYTYTAQFATDDLTLKISQTKVVAIGDVVVVAASNIMEEENVSVGFEWRRYDWPDEIENRSGGAYIYAGTIEGSIKNLNAEKFWKIRPYFLSQGGNRYWGDWVTIDPSDASYFEPTVHTYKTISIEDNTAEVKGFVMQGSDDVESQGFIYWENTPASPRRGAKGIPSNAKTVEAKGTMMVASLENLEYETEYCYTAFVRTSVGETYYGEEQSFKTGEMDPDGIEEIKNEELKMKNEGVWYSLDGKTLSKPQKGINIIRYSNGTTRKVLVK